MLTVPGHSLGGGKSRRIREYPKRENFVVEHLVCSTLSYGERNKVVKIPPGVDDLSFLRNVVKKTFLKVEETHGGANVYFQKYDSEWEEWVDVNEDFVAETKD